MIIKQSSLAVVFAIVLGFHGAARAQQEAGVVNQQLLIPHSSEYGSEYEVRIIPGNEFLVRRKGGKEWTSSLKLSDPIAVGRLDNGDVIYLPARSLKPPKARHMPVPAYPESERKSGKEGRAWLYIVVDRQGKAYVANAYASPGPEFSNAAVDALRTWTFEPVKLNRQSIAILINVSVDFRLY